MKNRQQYIGYLDLLGIRSAAKADSNRYITIIKTFRDRAIELFKKNQDIVFHIFSDSMYLQSKDLYSICNYLQKLRSELLEDEICFNAAVTKGNLKMECMSIDGGSSILDYSDKSVVKVYAMQVSFSGAGIFIDPDIIDKAKKQSVQLIDSLYLTMEERGEQMYTFRSCKDVAYGKCVSGLVQYIMSLLVKNYILSKRASRYYFTMYKTIITEYFNSEIDKKKSIEQLTLILNFCKEIKSKEYLEYLLVILIDTLYSTFNSNEKTSDKDIQEYMSELLDLIFSRIDIVELNDLCRYSSIIISEHNKLLLAEYKMREMYDRVHKVEL